MPKIDIVVVYAIILKVNSDYLVVQWVEIRFRRNCDKLESRYCYHKLIYGLTMFRYDAPSCLAMIPTSSPTF